jgi:hypothetical protein
MPAGCGKSEIQEIAGIPSFPGLQTLVLDMLLSYPAWDDALRNKSSDAF